MKVVILAGGLGTRLGELTETVPKPMVEIGNQPILWHIMQSYASFGYNEFVVALGYKGHLIKKYFLEYNELTSDLKIDLASGQYSKLASSAVDWKVELVDTGLQTMTGGRIKKLSANIGDEPFMLTYGDGLCDLNIAELVEFHRSHNKLATITAVRPVARFGEIKLDGYQVLSFDEKPSLTQGWINGGFMVLQPEVLELIDGDSTIFEREPLQNLSMAEQLVAYKHTGFWQCMDTLRDRNHLQDLWSSGAPWLKND